MQDQWLGNFERIKEKRIPKHIMIRKNQKAGMSKKSLTDLSKERSGTDGYTELEKHN